MTQSDKWAKRPCVERYRAWADECRLAATGSPVGRIQADTLLGIVAFFHLPVPESWSEAKKREHYGRLHQSAGDVDNFGKGLVDSLLPEDKTVPIMQFYKLYVEEGASPRSDIFLLVPHGMVP